MNKINDGFENTMSDDLIKALRKLENVVSNARKGTCLMDVNKRSQARKKRKKNKKK